MIKKFLVLAVVTPIIFAMLASCAQAPKPSPLSKEIKITSPKVDQLVTSPLVLTGEAIGQWYFEAVFGVSIVDQDNNELGRSFLEAQSDWMTPNFVPFKGEIKFTPGNAKSGKVIFANDNPSGEPSLQKTFEVPVRFQ